MQRKVIVCGHIFNNLVITGQVQTAKLIEHHFRQCQSIFRFGKAHLRFIEFHTHLGQVTLRGHAFGNHRLHVLVQGIQQVAILTGECLFVLQRNHSPVGLIDLNKQIILFLVGLQDCRLIGEFRIFVHSTNLAAQIDGFCHRYGTGEYVSRIHVKSIGNFLSHTI